MPEPPDGSVSRVFFLGFALAKAWKMLDLSRFSDIGLSTALTEACELVESCDEGLEAVSAVPIFLSDCRGTSSFMGLGAPVGLEDFDLWSDAARSG